MGYIAFLSYHFMRDYPSEKGAGMTASSSYQVEALDPKDHCARGTLVMVDTLNATFYLIGDGDGLVFLSREPHDLSYAEPMRVNEHLRYFWPSHHNRKGSSGTRIHCITVFRQPLSLEVMVPPGMVGAVRELLAE